MKKSNLKIIVTAILVTTVFCAEAQNNRNNRNNRNTQSSGTGIDDHARQMAELENRRRLLEAQAEADLGTLELQVGTSQQPCQIYDCQEWFTGSNSRRGEQGDPNLAIMLLRDCQHLLRQKIAGRYQAVVHDYMSQVDVNSRGDVQSHIESAGRMIIDQALNDTEEVCRRFSDVDGIGNITMYMGVRVSKRGLAQKITEGLSEDENVRVRFNAEKFRESAFKVFEEVDAQ